MQIQKVPYEGWQHNASISNGQAELIVTLDVGPRVISYKTPGGHNVFKNYPEQLGGSGESEWMIRGGHRLWIAPEGDVSYSLDNTPVVHEMLPNGIRLDTPPVEPYGLRKLLTVTLDEDSTHVTLHHKVINESSKPIEISSWGLSVMAPGGLEIIPLPELKEHPQALLPHRIIVPWDYVDMTDPRWRFGGQFFTLRQTQDGGPTKLGLNHKEKWVAYLNGENLFIKAFDYIEGERYTDFGCNFETFTNPYMLEMETLSPLRKLQPGESVEHTENWYLVGNVTQPASLQDQDLGEWIAPIIERLGIK
jgi:hypothetical protein